MKILAESLSDQGPRSSNEDSIALLCNERGPYLFAVADGLGGHFGGEHASKIATDYLKTHVQDIQPPDFGKAFRDLNDLIISQQVSPELRNMATTLTVAWTNGKTLVGAHCGDTRCVVARGTGIRRLTIEHTEAQRLYEGGKLTKEQFLNYPRRNILDSALGGERQLRVDLFTFELQANDWIVLTSDGVHEILKLREMQKILLSCSTPQDAIDGIRIAVEERGAVDNFSAVCARFV